MVQQAGTMRGEPITAGGESPAWRGWLTLWMCLAVMLSGVRWTTGVVDYGLAEAVEQGTAEVEKRLAGEENEDVIRKAIQLQRDTLPFWTVIIVLRDYLMVPVMLGLRALVVAVAFAAVAALTGRPTRFPATMRDCVLWQGIWVLGMAVEVVLMLVLQRSRVDASVLLLLPGQTYTARLWTSLQQVDVFALLGWLGMAWAGWRRAQAALPLALLVCFLLALAEGGLRYEASLLIELSMRMTLFPQ
jgi:hypothetical protein